MLFRPIKPLKRRQNVSAISICKGGASSDAPLARHIAIRPATRKGSFPPSTPAYHIFFNRNNSEGRSTITNIAGKMKSTNGNTILTGARNASAFADWRRRSRMLSA